MHEVSAGGVTIEGVGAGGKAVPADGGAPSVMEHELIALPSHHEPVATIYRHAWGAWVLERPGEPAVAIRDRDWFHVGERAWQFHAPEPVGPARVFHGHSRLRGVEVTLSVSRDGECLGLRWRSDEHEHALRTHDEDYLLLQLARRMRADVDAGKPSEGCGWTSEAACRRDPLSRLLPLETAVFRMRKRLASLGFDGAADIVERIPEERVLRLGAVGVVVRDLGGSCDLSALKGDRGRRGR